MADNNEDLRNAAMRELARRELDRRRQKADPVGSAIQKTQGDDLAFRGEILPLGKTKEGKMVPAVPKIIPQIGNAAVGALTAIPEAVEAGGRAVKDAWQGRQPTQADVLSGASLGVLPTPSVRGGISASLAGKVNPKPDVMTSEGLQAAKSAAYKASEAEGVTIKKEPFSNFARDAIEDVTNNEGYHPATHPATARLLEWIGAEVSHYELPNSRPLTLERLDTLQQIARNMANEANAGSKDQAAAIRIKNRIGDFIDKLDQNNISVTGNPQRAVAALKEARGLAYRAARSEDLDEAMRRALNKESQHSAGGLENSLTTEFRRLVNNKKEFSKFSAEEQDALQDVARNGNLQAAMVKLGRFSPNAGFMAAALQGSLTGAALMQALEHPGAVAGQAAFVTAAMIARYAATKMREKAVQNAGDLIRGGRPISDWRVQQQMLTKNRARGAMKRLGIMGAASGAAGLLPDHGPEFNPLINPNQL